VLSLVDAPRHDGVLAGRDARVWTRGGASGAQVRGNRNVTLTSFADVSAPIQATTGSADVTVLAALSGDVTAGTSAVVWVLGSLTGDVTAGTGDAEVSAVGDMTNTATAGGNAHLTLGELTATVQAGGSAQSML
jgi:hypothetical protein